MLVDCSGCIVGLCSGRKTSASAVLDNAKWSYVCRVWHEGEKEGVVIDASTGGVRLSGNMLPESSDCECCLRISCGTVWLCWGAASGFGMQQTCLSTSSPHNSWYSYPHCVKSISRIEAESQELETHFPVQILLTCHTSTCKDGRYSKV